MAKVRIGNRYFDAVQGIVVDDGNGEKALFSKPDWNESDPTKAGFIKDRPFWRQKKSLDITTTLTDNSGYQVNFGGQTIYAYDANWGENFAIPEPIWLVGGTVTVGGIEYTLTKYCKSMYELQVEASKSNLHAVVFDGSVLDFPSSVTVIALVGGDDAVPVLLFTSKSGVVASDAPAGLYGLYIGLAEMIATNLTYDNVVVDINYASFFTNLSPRILVLGAGDLQTFQPELFEPGDIILGVYA
jgi:hypothetical protein